MKQDTRNPKPILSGTKLEFFYSILTLWESGKENKVIKKFTSAEIKKILARTDPHGVNILSFSTHRNKKNYNSKYELYIKDSKNNQGLSLLYHLRNAFAHNNITLSNNGRNVHIQHVCKDVLKLKTKIPFTILKELIETICEKHNLTVIENNKNNKHNENK